MRTLALLVACSIAAPAAAAAQGLTWTTDRTLTYSFDFGPAADDADRLGLHYDLRYEISRARPDPRGHHFGLAFSALGFQTASRDSDAVNTLAAGAALTGRYYQAAGGNRLAPEDQLRWLELLDKPIEDLTAEETEELRRFNTLANAGRRFLMYDGHYAYVTSQTTNARQNALGASLSGELPAVHRWLDALLGLTRTDASLAAYVPQPVRAYIGGDWVFGRSRRLADVGTADFDDYPRLRAQLAWRTLVLNGLVLRATFEGELMLDRPADLQDVDRFQAFFQTWLVYPLGDDGAGLMVKYVAGHVGPSFEEERGVRLGLNFILQ